MNNNQSKILLTLVLAMLWHGSKVSAQNPLRRVGQDQFATQGSQVSSASFYQEVEQNQQRNFAPNQASQATFIPNRGERIRTQVSEPKRNDRVFLAGFQEIPKPQPGESQQGSEIAGAQVLGSTIDKGWQDPKRIADLIMKISLNLVFVLSFAFGVILIAKKLGRSRGDSQSGDRAKSDSLSVLQTLRIDPKISIRLVQWRSNRFLVACDQNGIQSVNPLNESFEQTLKELDDEQPSDEKLLKKLLAGLETGRGQ